MNQTVAVGHDDMRQVWRVLCRLPHVSIHYVGRLPECEVKWDVGSRQVHDLCVGVDPSLKRPFPGDVVLGITGNVVVADCFDCSQPGDSDIAVFVEKGQVRSGYEQRTVPFEGFAQPLLSKGGIDRLGHSYLDFIKPMLFNIRQFSEK